MTIGYDQLPDCAWTELDVAAVAKYTKKKKNTDWVKPSLAEVRTRLRELLLKSQHYSCAYCRRRISVELGHHEIDHILPKGLPIYARFTYERINLVATCKRCNRNKGDHNILIATLAATESYPKGIDDYLWVHPYLHKYFDHLRILEGMLFEAKGDPKQHARGAAVIDTCKLDTLAGVERRRAGEIAIYAANAIDAITDTVGAHRLLDNRALVTMLQENRKELRDLPQSTVEGLVAAYRLSNFEDFARELKAAGLQ